MHKNKPKNDILNLQKANASAANEQWAACLTGRVSDAHIYLRRANSAHPTVHIGMHYGYYLVMKLSVVKMRISVILQKRTGLSFISPINTTVNVAGYRAGVANAHSNIQHVWRAIHCAYVSLNFLTSFITVYFYWPYIVHVALLLRIEIDLNLKKNNSNENNNSHENMVPV